MKKLKIYLDTSVISHLQQDDVPDKMKDTLKLWEEIKEGRYNVCISEITINEILAANKHKRSIMVNYLDGINYNVLKVSTAVQEYANVLNEIGVLSAKHYDDCLHIGCAVVNNCSMILSWNFKHIVRVKTVNGVRYVNSILGYGDIGIYPPSMIIE